MSLLARSLIEVTKPDNIIGAQSIIDFVAFGYAARLISGEY